MPDMIGAIATLLLFQLAGEALARVLALPVPGPVLGMVLLFAALALRRAVPPEPLSTTANGLLAHLSLLFVPAGVGIIVHLDRLAGSWAALVATVVLSTVVTAVATAFTLVGLERLRRRGARR